VPPEAGQSTQAGSYYCDFHVVINFEYQTYL